MMMLRQGDLLLVATDAVPDGLVPVPADGDHLVLAYGEVSGHAHALADDGRAVLLRDAAGAGEDRIVVRGAGALLIHEEHAALPVPVGAYRVIRQRVYEPRRAELRAAARD